MALALEPRTAVIIQTECTCGMITCVCVKVAEHPDEKCSYRTSLLCPVAIECDHGRDVCPICDPCTCKEA